MRTQARRLLAPAVVAALAAVGLLAVMPALHASNPPGAYYCADTDKVFWFVQASDVHVGTSGSTDSTNLQWLVTTARATIAPSFIVVTGDLTDSTNGNIFGYPNGPYQAEWDQYKSILSSAGVTAADYYDLPGNHDAYNDASFAYYRANSVQGRATGRMQQSWTRTFAFGKYHFLGVNSADNTGAAFSIFSPYGDHAGLDDSELSFIRQELTNNVDAQLTMVFGHHPVTDTGASGDTWLFYGQQEFIADLDGYRASAYGYGHTHENADTQFSGNSYTGTMGNGGVRYSNVAALGKDSSNSYRLFAIDCNGVSSVVQTVGAWPLVLITSPVNKYVGSALNPYAYTVPNASTNTIRALVFDTGTINSVSFQVGGGTPVAMTRVAGSTALWTGAWNASTLAPGDYAITVTAATTSGTRSNSLTVAVTGAATNQPPVAAADSYTTTRDTSLTVPAKGVLTNDSDPEGTALTAVLGTSPAHGGLTAFGGDGSFTYVPASGYVGSDSFTYTARDAGGLLSSAATVTLTISSPTDTVVVKTATYTKKTGKLAVTATSSAQPNATLTVAGYGPMTWNSKSKTYTGTYSTSTAPATVTVTSSLGGSASLAVRVR